MNKEKLIHIFWLLLRLGLGAMFVYASIYKIQTPGSFAHQIYNYKVLPSWAINPLAITLPWLQLYCGLALIINRFSLGASIYITLMLVVFQTALGQALVRGLDVSCGCFESGGDSATWTTFLRDTLFLGLAALLTWKEYKRHAAQ